LDQAQVGEPPIQLLAVCNVPPSISTDDLKLCHASTLDSPAVATSGEVIDWVDLWIDAFLLLPPPRTCAVIEILNCLKKYGQRLDLEIAKEMGLPLATVRQRLSGLAATGAIITCSLTRFENGKQIDAWQCRVSGYVPPLAPGRKAKATP
jgi:hypothetical protein